MGRVGRMLKSLKPIRVNLCVTVKKKKDVLHKDHTHVLRKMKDAFSLQLALLKACNVRAECMFLLFISSLRLTYLLAPFIAFYRPGAAQFSMLMCYNFPLMQQQYSADCLGGFAYLIFRGPGTGWAPSAICIAKYHAKQQEVTPLTKKSC